MQKINRNIRNRNKEESKLIEEHKEKYESFLRENEDYLLPDTDRQIVINENKDKRFVASLESKKISKKSKYGLNRHDDDEIQKTFKIVDND